MTLISETWRPVVGWENLYEVSSWGRVRNSRTGRVLIPSLSARGYLTVSPCRNNKKTTYTIHRLVMEAFVGPKPAGFQVLHGTGGPKNNQLSNLRYGTPSENETDKLRDGTSLRGRSWKQQLTAETVVWARSEHAKGRRIKELAKELGIHYQTVRKAIRGSTWAWL